MSTVSDAGSSGYSAGDARTQLATKALKSSIETEQRAAEQVSEAAQTLRDQETRQARKIPGMGNAVDISA